MSRKNEREAQFQNRDRLIELGLTIASLRKLRGMTQQQLADKARISRSHLSSIEAPNIARPFSLEVLYNIADALEVDAGYLLLFWKFGESNTEQCKNRENVTVALNQSRSRH